MDRLTERFHAKRDKPTIMHHGHRWGPAFFPGDGYSQYVALLDRLAAYEDTGMTPEEVAALRAQLEQVTAERDAYARIGTTEEFARLADKAIPIKPFKESLGDRLCNSCGAGIGWDALNDSLHLAPRYCSNCGQPIDWSDEEGGQR